jgi:hypothetical protein
MPPLGHTCRGSACRLLSSTQLSAVPSTSRAPTSSIGSISSSAPRRPCALTLTCTSRAATIDVWDFSGKRTSSDTRSMLEEMLPSLSLSSHASAASVGALHFDGQRSNRKFPQSDPVESGSCSTCHKFPDACRVCEVCLSCSHDTATCQKIKSTAVPSEPDFTCQRCKSRGHYPSACSLLTADLERACTVRSLANGSVRRPLASHRRRASSLRSFPSARRDPMAPCPRCSSMLLDKS